jgi:hypothetical protein
MICKSERKLKEKKIKQALNLDEDFLTLGNEFF